MPKLNTRCLLRGGIRSLELEPPEALVLMALAEYDGREGICVSQQTIEDGVKIKRENVGKIIRRLADRGIIRIVKPGRQHNPAVIEITVRCDATSHLHKDGNATLSRVRCDATSHLAVDPDVTQRKHLNSSPDVMPRHKSIKGSPGQGLPDLARSGPARPSVSQALRAADDDEEIKGSDDLAWSTASAGDVPPGGGRRGASKASRPPRLVGVPAQPQYARETWPTAVPGQPGAWTEPTA